MAFEVEFLELMPHCLDWESYSGDDADGNNTYATSAEVVCRLDRNDVSVGTTDIQEQLRGATVTTVTIYCQVTDPVMKPRDRLTLEDGTIVFIQSAVTQHDEDGPHHLEVQAQEGATS